MAVEKKSIAKPEVKADAAPKAEAAKKSTIQYYWIAVVLRGLLTIPGSIEKFENLDGTDIPQTVIMVICVLAIVAMAGFIALKLYKNYDSEQIIMPRDLFSKGTSPKMY